MAIDNEEKRRSAMDPTMPWRVPGVDPTRTGFDAASRAGAAGLYSGFGDPTVYPTVYSGNLRNVSTRRVYSEALAGTGITSDELLETYLDTLTENPELSQYDWSAMTVGTYGNLIGVDGDHTDDWTHSVPCTLISDTFAIAGDHNFPFAAESGKCWWITPAGTVVSAAVASETILTNSRSRLIKFSTNPSATLARFPICTNESLLAYDGRDAWCFFQNLTIKLRKLDGFVTDYDNNGETIDAIDLIEGDWTGDDINQGSGRPVLVPCTDNTLVIIGILAARDSATQNKANQVSLDMDQIASVLAAEGETFDIVTLEYAGDFEGIREEINTGMRLLINAGIR